MAEQEWVLASGNAGKARELTRRLEPLGIVLRLQSEFDVPEAEETGVTFIENALIKARNAAAHTGLPALADDSGLRVAVLDGEPGVHSARFAGPDADDAANNALLLSRLEGQVHREAAFHCSLVWLRSERDPAPLIAEGHWPGEILRAPRGEGGFGYDPLFWVPALERSAAELEPEAKNRLSHRGQAVSRLLDLLADRGH